MNIYLEIAFIDVLLSPAELDFGAAKMQVWFPCVEDYSGTFGSDGLIKQVNYGELLLTKQVEVSSRIMRATLFVVESSFDDCPQSIVTV